MTYSYAVFGCGQGAAIAYDLAKFGDASEVLLCDIDLKKCTEVAVRLNKLLGREIVHTHCVDVSNGNALNKTFRGVDTIVGAVSYKLNELLTEVAIGIGAHYIDLGGNTAVVRNQHKAHHRALKRGVTVVPDCGMGPGFNLSLANAVAKKIVHPHSIYVYCGGLPQKPEGLLNYSLFFSMDGLVNEYSGFADILSDGKRKKQKTIQSIMPVDNDFGDLGLLEASHTSGGLSTAPWTFPKLFPGIQNLEYKTLRYPGHFKLISEWKSHGVLRDELVRHLGQVVGCTPDVGVIYAEGYTKQGDRYGIEVIDRLDKKTGFSAMQRLTGFHASVMAIMATKKVVGPGVLAVESIDGEKVIREMKKRGIKIGEVNT